MKFPIYDISEVSWGLSGYKQHNILFENPYDGFIPCSNKEFEKRIKLFKFVDQLGHLYRVTGYKSFRYGFFRISKKIELDFIKTDEICSLEDFKNLIIKRAEDSSNIILEKIARNASSFQDILFNIKQL